jgi:MFS transporter, PPP family, 3-phenylpropionic acid transporter
MSLPPLTPEQRIKPRIFEVRVALIYAALFIPVGIHLPYFPLWLETNGFDAAEIGIILSAPMFVRVVTTPLLTAIADRAGDRANVLIATAAASLFLSLGYFLTPTYAVVLGISLALTIFWTPHSPLTDSLALSGVRRFGSSYTGMRLWGSMSFLGANLLGGMILASLGPEAVPAMLSLGMLATIVAALFAPRLGKPRQASPLSAAELQGSGPRLFNRYFLFFVAGVGIINGSHGLLYGFVSIYWQTAGIGETVVGLLWAWSVVAEVVVFMIFPRLLGSISATVVLTIAGVAAIIRWLAFPVIDPLGLGVPGFFAVQTLHAFSFGLNFIGLQKLIAEIIPEERIGAAQGIAFFANGFAMAAVTLLSGPLYERLGVNGFVVMAVVAGIGLGFVGLAARSSPERRLRR